MFSRWIAPFLIFVVSLGPVSAEPPAKVEVSSGSSRIITATVIPIPLEIFSALDKMGVKDWERHLEKRDFKSSPDRPRTALLLGLVISEGFLAVQAKNSAEVKRVGLLVQKLAEPLGVAEPVEERIKSILEALAAGNWGGVKQEMDRTRQTVLETMQRLRDSELATLVTLGGWIGGTQAVSAILVKDYSVESSDLLNQSGLLEQLKSDFDQLSAAVKEGELLKKIDRALAGLKAWMQPDASGVIGPSQVVRIRDQTRALVDAIYAN